MSEQTDGMTVAAISELQEKANQERLENAIDAFDYYVIILCEKYSMTDEENDKLLALSSEIEVSATIKAITEGIIMGSQNLLHQLTEPEV